MRVIDEIPIQAVFAASAPGFGAGMPPARKTANRKYS